MSLHRVGLIEGTYSDNPHTVLDVTDHSSKKFTKPSAVEKQFTNLRMFCVRGRHPRKSRCQELALSQHPESSSKMRRFQGTARRERL